PRRVGRVEYNIARKLGLTWESIMARAGKSGNPAVKGNRASRVAEQMKEEIAPREKATRLARASSGREYFAAGLNRNQDADVEINEPDSRLNERQANAPTKRRSLQRNDADQRGERTWKSGSRRDEEVSDEAERKSGTDDPRANV